MGNVPIAGEPAEGTEPVAAAVAAVAVVSPRCALHPSRRQSASTQPASVAVDTAADDEDTTHDYAAADAANDSATAIERPHARRAAASMSPLCVPLTPVPASPLASSPLRAAAACGRGAVQFDALGWIAESGSADSSSADSSAASLALDPNVTVRNAARTGDSQEAEFDSFIANATVDFSASSDATSADSSLTGPEAVVESVDLVEQAVVAVDSTSAGDLIAAAETEGITDVATTAQTAPSLPSPLAQPTLALREAYIDPDLFAPSSTFGSAAAPSLAMSLADALDDARMADESLEHALPPALGCSLSGETDAGEEEEAFDFASLIMLPVGATSTTPEPLPLGCDQVDTDEFESNDEDAFDFSALCFVPPPAAAAGGDASSPPRASLKPPPPVLPTPSPRRHNARGLRFKWRDAKTQSALKRAAERPAADVERLTSLTDEVHFFAEAAPSAIAESLHPTPAAPVDNVLVDSESKESNEADSSMAPVWSDVEPRENAAPPTRRSRRLSSSFPALATLPTSPTILVSLDESISSDSSPPQLASRKSRRRSSGRLNIPMHFAETAVAAAAVDTVSPDTSMTEVEEEPAVAACASASAAAFTPSSFLPRSILKANSHPILLHPAAEPVVLRRSVRGRAAEQEISATAEAAPENAPMPVAAEPVAQTAQTAAADLEASEPPTAFARVTKRRASNSRKALSDVSNVQSRASL